MKKRTVISLALSAVLFIDFFYSHKYSCLIASILGFYLCWLRRKCNSKQNKDTTHPVN
jgi:hypothetical protein